MKIITGSRRQSRRDRVRSSRSIPRLELLEDRTLLSTIGIVAENELPGNPASQWDISGAGDPSIQGFATDISVNQGQTVSFKINDASGDSYHIDIYRMGYYQGNGARKVTPGHPDSVVADATARPSPTLLTDPTTGLLDAGNWQVSASWAVPANATSGIYFAKVIRDDTGGASHIVFVVRDDTDHSQILFQTSDSTWEAYNDYGGNSLYTGNSAARERPRREGQLQSSVQHAGGLRPRLRLQRRVPDGPMARGQRLRRQLFHRCR